MRQFDYRIDVQAYPQFPSDSPALQLQIKRACRSWCAKNYRLGQLFFFFLVNFLRGQYSTRFRAFVFISTRSQIMLNNAIHLKESVALVDYQQFVWYIGHGFATLNCWKPFSSPSISSAYGKSLLCLLLAAASQ
jgi:hypothetical protein